MIAVSDADIRAAVSRNAYEAGRLYHAQGRVVLKSVGDDDIDATVRGSAKQPYHQVISVNTTRGGARSIDGACTCPVGYNCKHVAAALFAARAARGVAPADPPDAAAAPAWPPPGRVRPVEAPIPAVPPLPAAPALAASGLPYDVAAWLTRLEEARDSGSEEYPPAVRNRIFYVLSLAPGNGGIRDLAVEPMRVQLRKDDTPSDKPSRYAVQPYASHTARYLRPSDRFILPRLGYHGPNGYVLSGEEDAAAVLSRILATGRGRWQRLDGPVLREGESRPGRIVWRLGEDGRQSAAVEIDGEAVAVRLPQPWYVDPASGVLGPLAFAEPAHLVAALLAAPPVPPLAAGLVRAEIARRLPGLDLPAPAPFAEPERIGGSPVPHLRLLVGEVPVVEAIRYGGWYGYQAHTRRGPLARLSFGYGPVRVPADSRDANPTGVHEGRLYTVTRSRGAEGRAVAALKRLGLVRVGEQPGFYGDVPHRDDYRFPESDDLDWFDLLAEGVPSLEAAGWTVEADADFPIRLAHPSGDIAAEVSERSGIDWFDLHLGVPVDGERVDLVPALVDLLASRGSIDDILSALEQGSSSYLPLPDGRVLAVPAERLRAILAGLRDIFAGGGVDTQRRRIGFSRHSAAELAALEAETAAAGLVWKGGESLRALGARLRGTAGIPPVDLPAGFAGHLRPYQARGVDWLQFLRQAGLGALLADDMGLGKTVQVLAHLAVEKAQGRLDRPALVVCPTSLVPNWRREAARFAPDLTVLTLHGPDRKAHFGAIGAHDLVVTTYPLLARDHAVVAAQPWHVAVLDEAQTIKNPDATTTKLAGELDARQRICLSGTPLENNLRELWSLFAFLAPGFLGDRKSFQSRFRTPIERHGDSERRAVLARRVRPFLLRRTKQEVAADLPAKTEIVEAVEMGDKQRAAYESIRLAMHGRVREAIAAKGLARSGIVILDALLKLRQACCDPRLLKTQTPAKAASAKLERLMELLPALLDEGRRILVFSQFTSMLALIEAELDRAGLPRLLLTGDTRDRDTPLRRFQAGEVPLFLISLKAGGTGLNLTAADTVIHYDPWWNPAVEDQATDRAHRIGQDKAVFVHKLVTLGTIEEKMEALKEKKRALVAGILEDAGQGIVSALSEAEVEALFAPDAV